MSKSTYIDPSDVASRIKSLQGFRPTKQAVVNAAGVTLTAANLLGQKILRSGAVTVSDTLPTAAQIVGAIQGAAVGDCFDFEIRNGNTGVLTLVAGAGNALEGTTTVTNANTRRYVAEITAIAPAAVTIHGMSTSAV